MEQICQASSTECAVQYVSGGVCETVCTFTCCTLMQRDGQTPPGRNVSEPNKKRVKVKWNRAHTEHCPLVFFLADRLQEPVGHRKEMQVSS